MQLRTLFVSRSLPLNDIGLIKLKFSFKFNDRVQSISLPNTTFPDRGFSDYVTLSGWGATYNKYGWLTYPETLQTLTGPIIDRNTCNNYLDSIGKEDTKVRENEICIGPMNSGFSACMVSII